MESLRNKLKSDIYFIYMNPVLQMQTQVSVLVYLHRKSKLILTQKTGQDRFVVPMLCCLWTQQENLQEK